MSKRIYIGPSGGNFVFRIAPAGYDADNQASPAVFSSDGDYLKVHAVIDQVLNKTSDSYWGAYTFPTLGYCPMAFISVGSTNLNRVFYPNDRNPATTEMNNFWEWGIQDGKVWIGAMLTGNSGAQYRFRCLIFKNRADRYTAA